MIGTGDPLYLNLTGGHIGIDHHMIDRGHGRYREQVRRTGEREPMTRTIRGITESRTKEFTH